MSQVLSLICVKWQKIPFSGRKIHTTPIGVLWINDEMLDYFGGTDDIKNNHGLFHGTISGIHIFIHM